MHAHFHKLDPFADVGLATVCFLERIQLAIICYPDAVIACILATGILQAGVEDETTTTTADNNAVLESIEDFAAVAAVEKVETQVAQLQALHDVFASLQDPAAHMLPADAEELQAGSAAAAETEPLDDVSPAIMHVSEPVSAPAAASSSAPTPVAASSSAPAAGSSKSHTQRRRDARRRGKQMQTGAAGPHVGEAGLGVGWQKCVHRVLDAAGLAECFVIQAPTRSGHKGHISRKPSQ